MTEFLVFTHATKNQRVYILYDDEKLPLYIVDCLPPELKENQLLHEIIQPTKICPKRPAVIPRNSDSPQKTNNTVHRAPKTTPSTNTPASPISSLSTPVLQSMNNMKNYKKHYILPRYDLITTIYCGRQRFLESIPALS